MGLLEVEVTGQVIEKVGMLPAQQGQPLLVTHVALVLEEKGLDQLLHGGYPDGRREGGAGPLSVQVMQNNPSV